MAAAIGVLIFIVGLLVSIALHEVGHMVPAKKFGVRVSEYFVGFGPTLWSRKGKETEYGFNNVGLGWVGLTDADEWAEQGAYEMGNTSAAALPAFKDGSTELRNVPTTGERGEGFIWVTEEPFEYQPWNGARRPSITLTWSGTRSWKIARLPSR